MQNTDPQFVNKRERDYRLKASSPCIDRGKVIPGFTQSYEGKAPDIGAYEGDKLVEGPPFYTRIPPGGLLYTEKPRITRHRVKGPVLTVFFSWPLRPATLSAKAVKLTVNGQPVEVRADGSFSEFIALGGAGRQQVVIRSRSPVGGVREETRTVDVGS